MKPKELKYSHWIKYNCLFVFEHFLGYKLFKKWFGSTSNKLFQEIDKSIVGKLNPVTEPIPEMDADMVNSDYKFFKKSLKEPILFRGGAKDWEATKKWNLDYFETEYGDRQILMNDLVGTIDPNNPQEFRWISLKEYIGMLRSGSLEYLKFSPLVQNEKTLQQDLNLNWLRKFESFGSFGKTFYLFIGGKGTITPIHNEFPSVVYVQISGHKKWTVLLPEDRVFMDPRTERRIYFYTNADPKKSENPNYPLFKYARKFEATLGPGDVLWFPPFAWHHVENYDESIGVSYKFANFSSGLKASKMMTILFLMATKPNLLLAFVASRFKKDDYTLTKSEKELK
jgi:hypothetical protein